MALSSLSFVPSDIVSFAVGRDSNRILSDNIQLCSLAERRLLDRGFQMDDPKLLSPPAFPVERT